MRMTEEEFFEFQKKRGKATSPAPVLEKKPPKYRNKKVTIADPKTGEEITFDSKKECEFYFELLAREKAGEVYGITRQVEFTILEGFTDRTGKKHRPIKYIADFYYKERINRRFIGGRYISDNVVPHIVDVKGGKATQTAVYKLKKKLLAHQGVIIEEI